MYSQAPSELPNGYSGSAFSKEPPPELCCEPENEKAAQTSALPTKRGLGSSLRSVFDRFRIGRSFKGFDLEDLLILALALLLLLEDGEGDLFPILLLFLVFQ